MTPSNSKKMPVTNKVVVDNRQASHLYHIEDSFEAGIVLEGWEVKSILAGLANFNGGSSFIRMVKGEAFVEALTITPQAQARKGLLDNLQPTRARKLLLHKTELLKLERRVARQGYTIVPLSITYSGKLKLNIGLAKGKNQADKRQTVKDRELSREAARAMR